MKTLLLYLRGLVSFLIFLITVQFFTLLVVVPISLNRRRSGILHQKLLTGYARFILRTHLNISLRVRNYDKSLYRKPHMIVCNHLSFIDAPMAVGITPNQVLVTRNWLDTIWYRLFFRKYITIFAVEAGIEKLSANMKKTLEDRKSILIFPEGNRPGYGKINRFHKGSFFLAYSYNLPVLPVVFYGSEGIFLKKWFYLKHGDLVIRYLPPVIPGSEAWGCSYQDLTRNVCEIMRSAYAEIRAEFEAGL